MTEAAATVQAIFHAGFLPSALEIADRFTLEAARRDKGVAHVPAGHAHLLVEVDGQVESVRSEAAALGAIDREPKSQFARDARRRKRNAKSFGRCAANFSNSLRAPA